MVRNDWLESRGFVQQGRFYHIQEVIVVKEFDGDIKKPKITKKGIFMQHDTNAILHLICKGRGNQTGVPTELNGVTRYITNGEWDGRTYQSGFWDFKIDEAIKLIGGSLFLHFQKKRPSTVGGTVLDAFEKELTDDDLGEIMVNYVGVDKPIRRNRVVFIFKSMSDCSNVEWRGNDWMMSYNGGIITDIHL